MSPSEIRRDLRAATNYFSVEYSLPLEVAKVLLGHSVCLVAARSHEHAEELAMLAFEWLSIHEPDGERRKRLILKAIELVERISAPNRQESHE